MKRLAILVVFAATAWATAAGPAARGADAGLIQKARAIHDRVKISSGDLLGVMGEVEKVAKQIQAGQK